MDVEYIMLTAIAIVVAVLILGAIAVGIPMTLAKKMKSFSSMMVLAAMIYAVIIAGSVLLTTLAMTLQFDGRITMLFIVTGAGCIISGWNLRPAWEQCHSEP